MLAVLFAAASAAAQKIQPDVIGGPGWVAPEIGVMSSGSPSAYGSSVTFTASIAPGSCASNTVAQFYDGGTFIGSAPWGGTLGHATLSTSSLAVGTHTITAHFAGSVVGTTTCRAENSNPVSQVVNQGPPTITSSTLSSTPAGAQGSFVVSGSKLVDPSGYIGVSITGGIAASVTTATSTQAIINFSIPATLSPGTQSVSISNSYGTSPPSSFYVSAAGPVSTTTVLTSSPNPSAYDQSVILSATVTASGGASPNGAVAFFDGATNIGSGNILYGNAALTVSNLSVGTHTLTAQYQGAPSFSPSTSSPVSQVVQPIPTTTTISLSPATSYFNNTVGVAIQVSDTVGVYPTGSINCNATGSTWTFSSSLTNGTASSALNNLPVGTYSIGCSYSPSADFGSSAASAAETVLADTPTWANSGNMQQGLVQHTATLLSNGSVLIAGGTYDGSDTGAVATAWLYSPAGGEGQGVFTATGAMSDARRSQTATLLTSGPLAGKVLVVGGENTQINILQEAEIYDPAGNNGLGAFSQTTYQPNYPRSEHTAALLHDGTVLIAGGVSGCSGCGTWPLPQAEIFDPQTGNFNVAGSLNTPRFDDTATILQNGMVLIAGGRDSSNNATASAELYNPSTKTFTPTGSLNTARASHTATLLPDGQVLIAGGYDNNGNPTISAELYDPAQGTFSTTGNLLTARAGAGAVLLNDGTVLIYGGCSDYNCQSPATTAELYSPANGTFASATSLYTGRAFPTTVNLGYGVALATGGELSPTGGETSSVETFDNHTGVTGVINPKFIIMGITYAPPGPASSVSYTHTNYVGNTTTLKNSFQNTEGVNVSITAGGTATAGGKCCSWANLSTSGNAGYSWSQKSTSQHEVTVTGQTSNGWTTGGTYDYFSPVNHDYDIIWIWLNPVIVLTLDSSNPSALPVWNGYGYDTTDPVKGVDVAGVPVGCLNGDNPPGMNCSQYLYPLSRSWVNNQTYPNGDVPALTPTDYANILKADPFRNPNYSVIDGPGPQTGATTTDGRFTHATTLPNDGGTNEFMDYYQQSPQWQQTYTDYYTNSTTASQSADNQTTVSWGISDSFAGSFFGVEVGYKVTYTGSVVLDNKSDSSITNTTTDSASATVVGPPCNASPCDPLYSGVPPAQPGVFDIYQDNLYGSFMFVGVN
jgi:hypothetical protein